MLSHYPLPVHPDRSVSQRDFCGWPALEYQQMTARSLSSLGSPSKETRRKSSDHWIKSCYDEWNPTTGTENTRFVYNDENKRLPIHPWHYWSFGDEIYTSNWSLLSLSLSLSFFLSLFTYRLEWWIPISWRIKCATTDSYHNWDGLIHRCQEKQNIKIKRRIFADKQDYNCLTYGQYRSARHVISDRNIVLEIAWEEKEKTTPTVNEDGRANGKIDNFFACREWSIFLKDGLISVALQPFPLSTSYSILMNVEGWWLILLNDIDVWAYSMRKSEEHQNRRNRSRSLIDVHHRVKINNRRKKTIKRRSR